MISFESGHHIKVLVRIISKWANMSSINILKKILSTLHDSYEKVQSYQISLY